MINLWGDFLILCGYFLCIWIHVILSLVMVEYPRGGNDWGISMEELASSQESVQEDHPISYGACLAAARESLGLSQESVAKQLYLNRHLIDEIEQEAFHPSVAGVYRRGYVRSYARLLGLDEDDILTAYDAAQPTKKPASFFESTFMSYSDNPSLVAWLKRPSILFLFIIAALLSVLLLGWVVDRWWQPAVPTNHQQVLPITQGHAALTLPQQVVPQASEKTSAESPMVEHQSLVLPKKPIEQPVHQQQTSAPKVVASSSPAKPSVRSLQPNYTVTPVNH